MISNGKNIRSEAEKLREKKLRARDIALELNISEAELLAAYCDGETTILLKNDWQKLLEYAERFDRVMTLTRNKSAVLERYGVIKNLEWNAHASVVVNPDIDLRIFQHAWHVAYFANFESSDRFVASVQIFAKHGDAIHKIYIPKLSDIERSEFLAEFQSDNQSNAIEIKTAEKASVPNVPESFSLSDFENQWRSLKDTHDFFGILRKHKIHRLQALRVAAVDLAWKLEATILEDMLHKMAESETEIMIFVGNRGMIQISSGVAKNIKILGQWLNVLDKDANLHLNMEDVHELWAVRKPTEDGDVHSIEVFSKDGELIVSFFGYRKPGKSELSSWRSYIQSTQKEVTHA
jgi:putative hemin transport protein